MLKSIRTKYFDWLILNLDNVSLIKKEDYACLYIYKEDKTTNHKIK